MAEEPSAALGRLALAAPNAMTHAIGFACEAGQGLDTHPVSEGFNAYIGAVKAWEHYLEQDESRGLDAAGIAREAHEIVLRSVRREVVPWLLA